MPGSPKRADVDVILRSDNPLDFDIVPNGLPKGPNGELVFENNNHPGFQIQFHLQDPNGLDYLFPPNSDKEEAVWSKLGSGACPTSGMWEVFEPIRVVPQRTTLVVHNPNPSPAQGKFGYTLRVTNGSRWLDLDPGGDNLNGPRYSWTAAIAFIGGVAVGCLGTLGTQALLQG
jgi:hypothetical protein